MPSLATTHPLLVLVALFSGLLMLAAPEIPSTAWLLVKIVFFIVLISIQRALGSSRSRRIW